MLALARLPLARITRSLRAWVPILGWIAIAIGVALVTRRVGSAHGAEHALTGAFGGIALPLLVYAVVSAALGGENLARAGRSLVAFGATPWRASLAAVIVAGFVSALVAALVAGGVAAIAHGSSDPPLARDVLTSAWIGALGGGAYAAYFSFAATFGARGGGRTVALIVDWVLGSGTGALALITPRAHVRSLFAGTPPLDLAERASSIALGAIIVVYALLATARARK
jgi:hypothetical protein